MVWDRDRDGHGDGDRDRDGDGDGDRDRDRDGDGDRDRDGVRASGRARVVTCRVVGASGATLALTRGSGPARVRPRVRV